VGLAWLASGARPGTRLVSVEIDTERAGLVASLFADQPQLAVIPGDWHEIYRAGPFDLLVLDGGVPPGPAELLRPGGTIVIDDLTPASTWPPRFGGQVDEARMHWLTHPALDAAELRLAPTSPPSSPPGAFPPANPGRASSRRAGSPAPRA
jgi:predicted O-methyltransferase YrrM